jgi:cysteine desulfurase/selenocysteine lyase
MDPLFDPADFLIPSGISHVCAGGEPASLRSHADALNRYLIDKASGMTGRDAQEHQVDIARAALARLWNVTHGDIGFVSNVAEGMSMLIESLDWHEGDSICIDANEYPSVVGPCGFRRNPTIRLVQARGNNPHRLAACVDASTRIVAVSYVSYLTAERVDLSVLRRAADRVGAMLVVDFTQAAGYLPIEAAIADFAFAACYKWLLGLTGVAVAYWNRARQPLWAPRSAGWHSFEPGERAWDSMPPLRPDALRLTRGNPAHASLYALNNALAYLMRFEPGDIQRHVQRLTTALIAELASRQVPMTTPRDPARHGASVCIPSPDAQRIADAMHQAGVWTWNGSHRIRVSFHGYNTPADVERVAAQLGRHRL